MSRSTLILLCATALLCASLIVVTAKPVHLIQQEGDLRSEVARLNGVHQMLKEKAASEAVDEKALLQKLHPKFDYIHAAQHQHEHQKPVNPIVPTELPSEHKETNPKCTFNNIEGWCQSVSTCAGTSIGGLCPGPDNIQCCILQSTPRPGCGKAAVERAFEWVHVHLQYCQSANGQPDGDPSCSSVCHRATNKKWDAYRSDCSGLVSWAYGVPAPGRVTSEFAPLQTDISYSIHARQLHPGDALNSVPDEHIMIFVRWLNSEHTQAELLEEPGCSASPPYARVTNSAITHLSNGLLLVEENGLSFQPIRFRSNTPPC